MYNEYLQDAVPEPIEQPPENRTPAAGTPRGGVVQPLAGRRGGARPGAPRTKNPNLPLPRRGADILL